MDAVFAQIAEETITFGPGDDVKWRSRYEPLYPPVPEDVRVIRDEVYGPAARNQLDIYIPTSPDTPKPVLMYIHGGGFFSGDKRWSEKCYANIGYFFAQKGFVTVLVNHQLVPDVQYPGGADDMQLAREWIYKHIAAEKYGRGSVDEVFIFGHSSGGAHVATNLFAAGDPARPPQDPLFPPVAGLMLLDVPFWFDRKKPVRQKTISSYFGSDAEDVWGPKSALGLFQRLPDNSPLLDSRKLPIYLGTVEWEVPETTDANIMFFNAYRARSIPTGTLPIFHVLKNHNHLSDVLSIGTEDTAQSDKLLEFIGSCLGRDVSGKATEILSRKHVQKGIRYML